MYINNYLLIKGSMNSIQTKLANYYKQFIISLLCQNINLKDLERHVKTPGYLGRSRSNDKSKT